MILASVALASGLSLAAQDPPEFDFFMPVAPDLNIGNKLRREDATDKIESLRDLPYEVSDLYFLSSTQGEALGFRPPTAMLPAFRDAVSAKKSDYTLLIDEWKKYELVKRYFDFSEQTDRKLNYDWFQIGVAVRTIVFIKFKQPNMANSPQVSYAIFNLLKNPGEEGTLIDEMWATTIVIGLSENTSITARMPNGWKLLSPGGLQTYLSEAEGLKKVIWDGGNIQPIILGVKRSLLKDWFRWAFEPVPASPPSANKPPPPVANRR